MNSNLSEVSILNERMVMLKVGALIKAHQELWETREEAKEQKQIHAKSQNNIWLLWIFLIGSLIAWIGSQSELDWVRGVVYRKRYMQ